MVEFILNGTTLPAVRVKGGGAKKNTPSKIVTYPDKTKLTKTDVIKPGDIKGLDAEQAQPYLMAKTLQLTIEIESEEEIIAGSKDILADTHRDLLNIPDKLDEILNGQTVIVDDVRKQLMGMAKLYRKLITVQASTKQARANRTRLREIKNDILLDAGQIGVDVSSDAILESLKTAGTKKLNWKK